MKPLTATAKFLILLVFAILAGIILAVINTPSPILHLYEALGSVIVVSKLLDLT